MKRICCERLAHPQAVFPLLPVEAEHARGSQSEPEQQVPLLPGQQLPGSLGLRPEAADVQWTRSHLLVGKAKNTQNMQVSQRLFLCFFVMARKNKSEDTGMTVMQITLSRHEQQIGIFRSCPLQMHSPPDSGTHPSPWGTAEWT